MAVPADPTTLERRMLVAENLRTARRRRLLTQAELAGRSGVDRKTVSRIENGVHAVTIDHLFALAEALDVPAASLVHDYASAGRR